MAADCCRLWKEFRLGTRVWKLYECDPTECIWCGADTANNSYIFAMTILNLSEVHFDRTLPRKQRMEYVGHELTHVVCGTYNSEYMCGVLGCKPSDSMAAEERLACFIGREVMGALDAAGFLKGR